MFRKFDAYDGISFFGGLVFFAPVALLVRTQAGISEGAFFLLQALLSVTIFLSEVPTGILGDRMGYQNALAASQVLQLAARVLLMLAYWLCSPALFAAEAVVEGISCTFSSGTGEAYVYEVYGRDRYLSKTAQAYNCGTAGFVLSTLGYGVLYGAFGIPGLLAATVAAQAVGTGLAFLLPREQTRTHKPARETPRLLAIFCQRRALALMALASAFSVAGILVNFFFAEKLRACGLDVGWMSPIILLYSLIQMLAKPILDRLAPFPRERVLGITCAAAALVLMAFGLVNRTVPVLAMMLLLPLLLSLPGYYLGEQENDLIDSLAQGENRAASLSMLNMGVSLAEILALFASAMLTGAGVGACFLAVGGVLLALGIGFAWK